MVDSNLIPSVQMGQLSRLLISEKVEIDSNKKSSELDSSQPNKKVSLL